METMNPAIADGRLAQNKLITRVKHQKITMQKFMRYASDFCVSEAERVIVIDEYNMREWRSEWCYTGFTRASKSVIVQRA